MNDLETFGPNLKKAGKENSFIVPEGYFDSLPSRIQKYCIDHSKENQPIGLIFAIRNQLALVVGFCFFVLLAYAGYYYSQKFNSLVSFERTDYLKIVEESGTEFDEIQLFEAFSRSNNNDTLKKSSNDELLEYLLNDNIDIGTLHGHFKDIKP